MPKHVESVTSRCQHSHSEDTRERGVRIACFQRSRVFGGAEESLLTNVRAFAVRGLDVVVICSLEGVVADRFRAAGVNVCTLVPRGYFRARDRSIVRRFADSLECRSQSRDSTVAARLAELACRSELVQLDAALRKLSPTVFYGNMSAGGDHMFLKRAARLGIRTVSHQRVTPPVWTGRRVVCEANGLCTWFVSNSEWTKRAWIAHGLRSERHEVVYNTISRVQPAKECLRARLSLKPGTRLIGSLGRLEPSKRFEDGIDAFAAVAERFPEWHYLIIGDGHERSRLEQYARSLGAGGRIHFLGPIPSAAAYLDQLEVFMHPTPGEHFGRVIAEAMHAGAVVIGHASGGVTEMVVDGKTGFLFRDAAGLKESLVRVMTNPRDAALRERACARIEKLCGPENVEILTRLVSGTEALESAAAVAHE